MSDDMLAEYESHEQFVEPFSEFGGLMMQSGIPVRIKDSGGQGSFVRVPQPQAGEEDYVPRVQNDLSVAWEPTLQVLRSMVSISNATLRTTDATTLVAAPGADKVVIPLGWTVVLRYGGSNPWTNTPTVQFGYNNTGNLTNGAAPGFTQSQSMFQSQAALNNGGAFSLRPNVPFTVSLSAGLTGNAANDNTMDVWLTYHIIDV